MAAAILSLTAALPPGAGHKGTPAADCGGPRPREHARSASMNALSTAAGIGDSPRLRCMSARATDK
eukprot:4169320-Amphidinium_carterae.1